MAYDDDHTLLDDGGDETTKPTRPALNIVILGASFAGLAAAHGYLTKIMEELGKTRSAPRYKLILVGPSTCLFWNIGAPRAIVHDKQLPLDDVFVPFLPLFEEYPSTRFEFIQGIATGVNFESRTVVVDEIDRGKLRLSTSTPYEKKRPEILTQRLIRFHSLVIATGTSAGSELLSLHGPHERTISEIRANHKRLAAADAIVIAGGGCSGCEIAGQVATWLNRGKKEKPLDQPLVKSKAAGEKDDINGSDQVEKQGAGIWSLFGRKTKSSEEDPNQWRKTIILLTQHDRLLPKLKPSYGKKADAKLRKLGVTVLYNHRMTKAERLDSGREKIFFANENQPDFTCDVFIDATGVWPNTSFMPKEMLTASGYIDADPKSLRVPNLHRVYAVGDCASHSKNSIADVYDSMPILLGNLKNDLLEWEIQMEHPHGGEGAEMKLSSLETYEYVQNQTDSQLMPISRFGGVGIIFGHPLPSLMVYLMKGRDYRKGRAKLAAGIGKDPYAVI